MKERLDILLVNNGFFDSRQKAKIAIMSGDVYVNGAISDKAGTRIDVDAQITVKNDKCPFVGRGGYKLAKALDAFDISVSGAVAMDIGASTGGFTDCMLQNGAAKVYSVDVGYGQLDWKLRTDERVVNMEKVNVRYLDPATIPDRMDFISIDVSFISLRLILPVARSLMKDGALVVCLVKPQFEAGREQVGKKGIVKDKAVHSQVIQNVIGYCNSSGFDTFDLTYSPMTGAKGNIEYLLKASAAAAEGENFISDQKITSTIDEAHEKLE